MLQSDEPGDRHVHVRLPGTSTVREVSFLDDDDVLFALSAKDSNTAKTRGPFMCVVKPTWIQSRIKFLMDTVCGHDLISQRKVEKHSLEPLVSQEAVSFQSAKGVTDADIMSSFQAKSLKEPINAHVLGDTPTVLSVGKICMKQGYGCAWPPGRDPFTVMIDPDGEGNFTPSREWRHPIHSCRGSRVRCSQG